MAAKLLHSGEMTHAPNPVDLRRVEALREYAIMDTAPEEVFDDITRLTSFICRAPIALITLLDEDRQWFKSRVGLVATETPIKQAFCAHAIQQKKVFVVPDTMEDERFAEHSLVIGESHIRFYAGVPLITPQGVPIGMLCVMDHMPRQCSADQKEALAALARQVIALLEARRDALELEGLRSAKRVADEEVTTLRDLLPVCGGCHKLRDDEQLCRELEQYFARHAGTQFSHGICPECAEDFRQKMESKAIAAAN